MSDISIHDLWEALKSPTEKSCLNCGYWKDKQGCNGIIYQPMNKCRHHTRWTGDYTLKNEPAESYWIRDQRTLDKS